jgi:hypothetical protein
MKKLISIGTSASKGLGLHLYNRENITNTPYDFVTTDEEYYFNLNNSYSGLLSNQLGYSLEHIDIGYNCSFFDEIDALINKLNTDTTIKIVILQLSNLHRDFFIYQNKSYKLDFESYEGLLKSKEELIKDKDENFIKELNEDLELFLLNEAVWRSKQITKMLLKIEQLRVKLEQLNIVFKILVYFDDWKLAFDYFSRNRLICRIHINENTTYELLYDFVQKEKLRVMDDIPHCTDGHPNFQAHKIIANELYNNIKVNPLYTTI